MFRRGDEDKNEPIQPGEVESPRKQAASSGEVTVVGQGARLEGTLVSAGSLRIDGQVKGKVTADGDVTLSPQSRVDADIEAQNVTVAGAFKGNIVAKSKAELAKGGKVDGNVTSKTLVVAEGAVFSGQSIMGDAASAPPARPATPEPAQEKSGTPPEPAKAGA
jgi:adhesin HecA-like repeat protein